jgi:hypothetical protein
VPETEALQPRFHAAHTQVLGISVDSLFCHSGWAQSLGGISFPLLADFHPKGAVAQSYGLYLEDNGITDRATVIIDANGVVQHISSVTPGGRRNIGELAALCEKFDADFGAALPDIATPPGIGKVDALFVKSACGFSLKTLWAVDNLHLRGKFRIENVTDDDAAMAEMRNLSNQDKAPCLIVDGKPLLEADEIVKYLVNGTTTLD